MKLLVVSDIHAMSRELESLDGGYAGGSGGILRAEDRTTVDNQILAIGDALSGEGSDIDLLLCLGDLTHQAKRLPLMTAWSDIHQVATRLEIPDVMGIVGNHDVMSRATTEEGIEAITEFLQGVHPPFPTSESEFNQRYFATGVAGREYENCLLVCLNTCRTHGLGGTREVTEAVFNRGSLTPSMIENVVQLVRETTRMHVIVAMHHHPIPVTTRDDDNDQMARGETLLSELAKTGKNILLLHGHKHYVKVQDFAASDNSVVVFSSASLCAYPFDEDQTHFSNQFHVVEFDTADQENARGRILSWDWSANSWVKSTRPHMPAEVFFGTEPDLDEVLTVLKSLDSTTFINYDELLATIPTLQYVKFGQVQVINDGLAGTGKRLICSASKITGMLYEEEA